jgi:hypothetical protein
MSAKEFPGSAPGISTGQGRDETTKSSDFLIKERSIPPKSIVGFTSIDDYTLSLLSTIYSITIGLFVIHPVSSEFKAEFKNSRLKLLN